MSFFALVAVMHRLAEGASSNPATSTVDNTQFTITIAVAISVMASVVFATWKISGHYYSLKTRIDTNQRHIHHLANDKLHPLFQNFEALVLWSITASQKIGIPPPGYESLFSGYRQNKEPDKTED